KGLAAAGRPPRRLMAEIRDVVPMKVPPPMSVGPPLPASPTYNVPLGANAKPLGFSNPVATTVMFAPALRTGVAAAGEAVRQTVEMIVDIATAKAALRTMSPSRGPRWQSQRHPHQPSSHSVP